VRIIERQESVLVDLERSISSGYVTYWKPFKRGYTTNLEEAGRYLEEEAKEIEANDFDKRTVAINQSVIDNILR
jgi:hypothetical protein